MLEKQAHCLSLDELRIYEMFDQIQPDNLQEIMKGIIKRLQRELQRARSQFVCEERQRQIDLMRAFICDQTFQRNRGGREVRF